jgi:hypothetical protein
VVAPAGTGGENAVVADVVGARRRDAGRQAFQERDRLEQDMGGAVSPASLEAVAEASILELGEPLRGERGAGHVGAESFESSAVAGGDGHVGVQAEAGRTRAARWRLRLEAFEIFRLHPVAQVRISLMVNARFAPS